MDDNPLERVFSNSNTPASTPKKRSRARMLGLLVVTVIILAAAVFGAMQFLGGDEGADDVTPTPTEFFFPTDTPTPTPEEDLTPTPEEEEEDDSTPTPTKRPAGNPVDPATGLDRSDLTVNVLNGSGVAGAARKVADELEALGYTIGTVGNADNSDYAETVIEVSNANSKYLSLLEKDLDDYTIGDTSTSYTGGEARVIVGKN